MPSHVFLMVLGLPATVAGCWVAFNVRGSATAMEASQQRGHDLRAASTGDLSEPVRWVTAFGFRAFGTAVGLGGIVLILASVAELLTSG